MLAIFTGRFNHLIIGWIESPLLIHFRDEVIHNLFVDVDETLILICCCLICILQGIKLHYESHSILLLQIVIYCQFPAVVTDCPRWAFSICSQAKAQFCGYYPVVRAYICECTVGFSI